jgi:hypothetical protein
VNDTCKRTPRGVSSDQHRCMLPTHCRRILQPRRCCQVIRRGGRLGVLPSHTFGTHSSTRAHITSDSNTWCCTPSKPCNGEMPSFRAHGLPTARAERVHRVHMGTRGRMFGRLDQAQEVWSSGTAWQYVTVCIPLGWWCCTHGKRVLAIRATMYIHASDGPQCTTAHSQTREDGCSWGRKRGRAGRWHVSARSCRDCAIVHVRPRKVMQMPAFYHVSTCCTHWALSTVPWQSAVSASHHTRSSVETKTTSKQAACLQHTLPP